MKQTSNKFDQPSQSKTSAESFKALFSLESTPIERERTAEKSNQSKRKDHSKFLSEKAKTTTKTDNGEKTNKKITTSGRKHSNEGGKFLNKSDIRDEVNAYFANTSNIPTSQTPTKMKKQVRICLI